MPINHILAPQRKEREDSITNNDIRASIGLLPLKAHVKTTSSPMTSKSTKSSKVSPALQSSQSSNKKQTPPKTPPKISPKTQPKTTTKREKPLLLQLDPDLLNQIYKMSLLQNSYVLRKWIDIEKLHLTELCANPNATSFLYEMFKANPDANIRWDTVSENPNAIELLKKRIAYEKTINIDSLEDERKINWNILSANPNAIELLKEKIKEEKTIDPDILENLESYQKIDWTLLCKNLNAIELLKANMNNINGDILYNKNVDEELITRILETNLEDVDYFIWAVPKALRILIRMFPDKNRYDWNNISKNTSYKAIQLLKVKALEEYKLIEENPSAYKLLLKSDTKVINWDYLSSNPKAIELLTVKALKEKELRNTNPREYYNTPRIGLLCWTNLSTNPKAIELLKEKAIEEKEIRATNFKYYESLPDYFKINWTLMCFNNIDIWYRLSSNPKAIISFLETKAIEEKQIRDTNFKEYDTLVSIKDRIAWNRLSLNPNAISLLETKAIEEHEMRKVNPEKYKALTKHRHNLIDSYNLSANPKAIKLLEKYPEYIDFRRLCENPNAVKLIRKNIDNFKTDHWEILSANPCIFKETSN
jgi:F0F1-type ATP synthase gamma subunit